MTDTPTLFSSPPPEPDDHVPALAEAVRETARMGFRERRKGADRRGRRDRRRSGSAGAPTLDAAAEAVLNRYANNADLSRYAISAQGLTKRFDDHVAVNNLNLQVPSGSFFGLVGPNGAGKSTTLSMITGLLRPDAGKAWIGANDTWEDPIAAKQRIGVLPETLRLFERLTGPELLFYVGRIRGMDPDVVDERAEELLETLGLADARNKLVTDYSTGMRKKVGLAAALLHAPEVLFLDEPFESVDPISVRTIRTVLERFTDSGATIVFSSHVMPIVEELCDRVAIMSLGNLVIEGEIHEVRDGRRLEEVFVDLVGAEEVAANSLSWLQRSSD